MSDETSANADTEILAAARPSLATTGGPLIIISSPYARRGEVWEVYRKHFGSNGDPLILVAQAASRDMNPSLPDRVVQRAIERDPAAAKAEYFGQFRTDLEAFIAREVVDAAVIPDRHELPPISSIQYTAFVDPSGGSADSMTIAIAHLENQIRVLDAVRERKPPFSPENVVEEFASLLKTYRVHSVMGDRYAGEWPRERFRVHGIEYEISEKPKSIIYGDFLPAINSGTVELLDHKRLVSQR